MTWHEPEASLPLDSAALATEPLDPMLVAEALADLAAGQARLEETVDQLAGQSENTSAPGRWTWCYLSAADAETLMVELADWVEWLVDRYQLYEDRHAIEACWAEHPVAVEELTALMVAWKAEFGAEVRKPSAGPISWHANWLWPTLERVNIVSGTRSCRTNGHRDKTRTC